MGVLRPKVKLKSVPSDTWLPQALQHLNLDEEDLRRRTIVGASCEILKHCKGLRRKQLRQLYQVVKRSSLGLRNKTYMIKHVCYNVSLGLRKASQGMRRNYAEFCHRRPEEQLDIYGSQGRPSGGETVKVKKKKKKEKLEKKQSTAEKRGGRPTITSLILDAVKKPGGSTKEEIVKSIVEVYPEKKTAAPKTVSVQLGYHLPKKFGNSFKQKGEKYILTD